MLIIIVYILIAFSAGFVFFKHLRVEGISVSTTFHIFYLLYYFIVPPVVLYLIEYTSVLSVYIRRFQFIAQADDYKRWLALALAVIGYIIFLAFFYKHIFCKRTHNRMSAGDTLQVQEFNKSLFSIGKAFSVVGIISMLVVIIDLGGVSNMISIAADLRGYNVEKTGFFSAIGAMCLTLAPFFFGGAVCMFSCLRTKRAALAWFIVDVVFIILYLLFDQGRGPIIFFVTCIVYACLKKKNVKESRIIGIFIVAAVIIVLTSGSLRSILRAVSGGGVEAVSFSDNIDSIVNDLSYPYGNTLYVTDIVDQNGYRYFSDYYLWVIELMPSRLLSVFGINIGTVHTLTDITSFFWSQGKEYLGGVPVDIITSGYMQAGVIGVMLNSCVVLLFIKWLDGITKALPGNCSAIRFWCCCTITSATVLSMDLCKLPLAYLYMFILVVLLRESLLQVGLYSPSLRVQFWSKSFKHIWKGFWHDE